MNLDSLLILTNDAWIDIASLTGRVFIGVCFVIHGLGKLGIVGPGNMQGFIGWLESLKFPMPELMARMAMLTELAGGALLTLGLFSRPACIGLFFTMIIAASLGHKGGGYLITNEPPGNEYTINLMAILFVLFLLGPGTYSLDFYLF